MTARLLWWRLIWWASIRSHAAAVREARWTDARRLWEWVCHCESTVGDIAEQRHWRGR